MRYQVTSPLVAVRVQSPPDQQPIVSIPAGSVVAILRQPDASSGLVEVEHAGEKVLVFSRDLEDRAQRVKAG